VAFPFPLVGVVLAGVVLAVVVLAGVVFAEDVLVGVALVGVALAGVVLAPFFGGVGLARMSASSLDSLILCYFRGRLGRLGGSWSSSCLVLEGPGVV
jgi:hypothetical protein